MIYCTVFIICCLLAGCLINVWFLIVLVVLFLICGFGFGFVLSGWVVMI